MEVAVVNPTTIAGKDYPQKGVISIIAAQQKESMDAGNVPIPLVVRICLP
jgi:hypothetical protein